MGKVLCIKCGSAHTCAACKERKSLNLKVLMNRLQRQQKDPRNPNRKFGK